MNYSIYAPGGDGAYQVIEKDTGHVLYEGADFREARHTTKRLNSGAGFAGWTPAFMLTKFDVPKG